MTTAAPIGAHPCHFDSYPHYGLPRGQRSLLNRSGRHRGVFWQPACSSCGRGACRTTHSVPYRSQVTLPPFPQPASYEQVFATTPNPVQPTAGLFDKMDQLTNKLALFTDALYDLLVEPAPLPAPLPPPLRRPAADEVLAIPTQTEPKEDASCQTDPASFKTRAAQAVNERFGVSVQTDYRQMRSKPSQTEPPSFNDAACSTRLSKKACCQTDLELPGTANVDVLTLSTGAAPVVKLPGTADAGVQNAASLTDDAVQTSDDHVILSTHRLLGIFNNLQQCHKEWTAFCSRRGRVPNSHAQLDMQDIDNFLRGLFADPTFLAYSPLVSTDDSVPAARRLPPAPAEDPPAPPSLTGAARWRPKAVLSNPVPGKDGVDNNLRAKPVLIDAINRFREASVARHLAWCNFAAERGYAKQALKDVPRSLLLRFCRAHCI
mmetsp:Transcript_91160/g.294884  ORF Transcript_91160/g.294884 Transcript_91160/m.294884 type:complete len:433 (-) Transcript_91160:37-1335(-)